MDQSNLIEQSIPTSRQLSYNYNYNYSLLAKHHINNNNYNIIDYYVTCYMTINEYTRVLKVKFELEIIMWTITTNSGKNKEKKLLPLRVKQVNLNIKSISGND